jgi:hypothetical protein
MKEGDVMEHKCTARFYDNWGSHICRNKAKHDIVNGVATRCGIHSSAAKEKRKAKRQETSEKWRRKFDEEIQVQKARKAAIDAIKQIAAGHNNPRELVNEVVAMFPRKETL